MTTYEVTASNRFCWQKLAVQAADPEAAAKAFRDYLAAPAQQDSEAYELEEAKKIADEAQDRSNYRYRFDDGDVEEADELNYARPVGATVRMIGSGGNG